MKRSEAYLQKLGELWFWHTGENFRGMSRDKDTMNFGSTVEPGVVLIKYPASHIERELTRAGFTL